MEIIGNRMSIYTLLIGISLLLHVSFGTPQKRADFHELENQSLVSHLQYDQDKIARQWTRPKEQICNDSLSKVKHIPSDGLLATEARYVSNNTIQCQVVTQQNIASSEQVRTLSQSTLRFLVVPDTGSVAFID